MARGTGLRLEDMSDPMAYDDSPIWDIDKRTAAFRRLVASVNAIYSDLGGSDHLSFAQRALAQQMALYNEWLNVQWQRWLKGESINMERVVKVTNSMRDIAVRLGIERKLKDIPSLDELMGDDQ